MGTLARQYQQEQAQRVNKSQTNRQGHLAREKRQLFSAKEKFLFVLMVIIIAYFAVSIIKTQSALFEINNKNVVLQKEIDLQTKLNKDLADQVSVLSMPEIIIAKAQQQGLTLNDKNVKAVEK